MDAARKARLDATLNARVAPTPQTIMNRVLGTVLGNAQSTTRADMLRRLFDPRRDIDDECGYPKTVTEIQYRTMYDREVGRRVVNVYPEETWKQFPMIFEDPDPEADTPFEASLDELEQRHHLLHFLQRADELSGVGHYGVILWGLDDGQTLEKPVAGSERWEEATGAPSARPAAPAAGNLRRVLFIRVLDESLVTVGSYERDVTNPRYGLPTYYLITLSDPNRQESGAMVTSPDFTQVRVHWSRITHVADNRKTSEVLGTPRQEPVWNRLCDLRKVMGGSGEMFWRGGFPGISLETQPGIDNAELDLAATREMMQDYMNGLQRYLAMTGMSAKSLAPQIADPTASFDVQIKAICITLGVPYRVFMGIEEGVVSGDQATKAWAGRLANRQNRYVTPMLINPVIQRLMDYGVLAPTAEPRGWTVEWPNLMELTALEKAEVAAKRTEAFAKYVGGGVDVLIPPLEYLTTICGMTDEEARAIVDASIEHIDKIEVDEETIPGRPPVPEPEPQEKPDVVLKPGDKLVPGGKPARGNPKPPPKKAR